MKTKELKELAVSILRGEGTLEDRIRRRFQLPTRLAKAYSPKDLNSAKDHSFPPGPLDSATMAEPRWGNHHPETYHGLNPGKPFVDPEGVTKHIHLATDNGGAPKAVLKGPLDHKELKIDPKEDITPDSHSHLMNHGFRTTHREAAFHKMANNVFGLGEFVPKTSVFKHPRTGDPWSAMGFVPNAQSLTDKGQLHQYENTDKLHKLALMDTILGNHDRHGGNVLLDDTGHINLIDNAGSFDYSHKMGNSMPKYANHLQRAAVPASAHNWLQGLNEKDLADNMIAAGAPTAIAQASLKRLAEAKRWSRVVQANPSASKDLGGALAVIQSHKLGNDPVAEDARRSAYNQIKRGESIAETPPSNKADDVTQIRNR